MKTPFIRKPLLAAALCMLPFSSAMAHKKAAHHSQSIEVCFVLDTTGSMGGLIAGAKRKIWKIANDLSESQPSSIRFGLVGYRDRGDDYITKQTALTDDLDAIHVALQSFRAGGGGDGPESVNQGLFEAVSHMKWSDAENVKKMIFLVGDAPPHMDYEKDVQYPDVCKLAVGKGILINTLLCGADTNTAKIWQEISQQSNGAYAAIPQDSGTQQVKTPQDQKIAELSAQLNRTVIGYGEQKMQAEIAAKTSAADGATLENQAWRACYNMKNLEGKVVSGKGDLVDAYTSKDIILSELKQDELPKHLQGLDSNALEETLKKEVAKRKKIQSDLKAVLAEREKFLKSAAPAPEENSFDKEVSEILGKQLKGE